MDYKGYDIIKQIGKGSFSNVYLCKQKYHILIDNGYKDDLFIIKEININELVKNYMKEKNIKMVIDKKNILQADESLDITKDIMNLLNKNLKSIKLN